MPVVRRPDPECRNPVPGGGGGPVSPDPVSDDWPGFLGFCGQRFRLPLHDTVRHRVTLGCMELHYTVRVRVPDDGRKLGVVSAEVVEMLHDLLPYEDVTVWPHDDSRPSGLGPGSVEPPVFG